MKYYLSFIIKIEQNKYFGFNHFQTQIHSIINPDANNLIFLDPMNLNLNLFFLILDLNLNLVLD